MMIDCGWVRIFVILYNTICRHHMGPFQIVLIWNNTRMVRSMSFFQCCTKYNCFVDFVCWQSCRPSNSVCWHDAADLFSIISDDKWPVDGIKTRILRQETSLLQKITHHNNTHHPCPSKHQRSLFGKRIITQFQYCNIDDHMNLTRQNKIIWSHSCFLNWYFCWIN